MKKSRNFYPKLLLTTALLVAAISSFPQTSGDTVKLGKNNDPMVVNPGKVNDGMAVKPAAPHDGMSVLSDTAFINKNIMDNRMEIELSKLGRDKGTSQAAKKVAALMITDHTNILNELEKLAARKNHHNNNHEMTMAPHSFPEGKEFDAAWAGQMLAMHEAKIAEMETFIGLTKDPELKAAVMKAIPKIKTHRDLLSKIPGAKEKANTKII
ncbi:MAG: outer membrane protein-like protein [Segetibacter sp.]|jgi:putative membrane protein|nr:outer membrane protein-like protein [Segetibacter sp.]